MGMTVAIIASNILWSFLFCRLRLRHKQYKVGLILDVVNLRKADNKETIDAVLRLM